MGKMCAGNICRSPAAEAVFRNLVSKRGLDAKFHIDSAGTIGYHEVVHYNYLLSIHFLSSVMASALTWHFGGFRAIRQIQG